MSKAWNQNLETKSSKPSVRCLKLETKRVKTVASKDCKDDQTSELYKLTWAACTCLRQSIIYRAPRLLNYAKLVALDRKLYWIVIWCPIVVTRWPHCTVQIAILKKPSRTDRSHSENQTVADPYIITIAKHREKKPIAMVQLSRTRLHFTFVLPHRAVDSVS